MSKRDAILARLQHEQSFEPSLTVDRAELIAVEGAVEHPERYNYCWIREYSMGGGVTLIFNPHVQPRAGLPVLVGPAPKWPHRRMILGVDWQTICDSDDYDGEAYLPLHARSHEFRPGNYGADTVNVYARAWVPLRVYGYQDLEISVAPGRYIHGGESVQFAGHVGYDLSSSKPSSGEARYVLVYLNKATGTIGIVDGAVTVDSATVVPDEPTLPGDSIGLVYVRLDGSQTSFSENDFIDIRTMWAEGAADREWTLKQLAVVQANYEMLVGTHIVRG